MFQCEGRGKPGGEQSLESKMIELKETVDKNTESISHLLSHLTTGSSDFSSLRTDQHISLVEKRLTQIFTGLFILMIAVNMLMFWADRADK